MDIKMSVMDGYTAAKMIRQFRPQMPIIAQTAIAVDTEQYIDAFDEYLTKPLRASEIISAIDRVLNQWLVEILLTKRGFAVCSKTPLSFRLTITFHAPTWSADDTYP